MKTICFITWCCYFSTSLGLPFKHARQTSDPGNLDNFVFPEWAITNFDGDCSPGGCILTFNMSSPETASEPAITASCNINGDELDWQQCASTPSDPEAADDEEEEGAVWARPFDAVDMFVVSIQHRFANASLAPTRFYNVTGNLTVDFEQVDLPADFTVMGTWVDEAWYWLNVRSVEDGGGESCMGQDHHVCEPVRNADGSIKGFMHLEKEHRLVKRG